MCLCFVFAPLGGVVIALGAASWLTFGTSLQNTIGAIDEGTLAKSRDDIKASLMDSCSYWDDVKACVQKLLDSLTEVKKVSASDVA